MNPPSIECRPVEIANPEDYEEVVRAFEGAEPLQLGQNWLVEPHPKFRGGTVRCGRAAGRLFVFAQLEDEHIFSRAEVFNDHPYKHGDVFEMFLRNPLREEYLELHVAPNGCIMQLRFPRAGLIATARQTGEDVASICAIPEPAIFSTKLWIDEPGKRWGVLAGVPLKELRLPGDPAGAQLKFSFSRYDYTGDLKDPAHSSTSPHRVLNFHDQRDWGTMQFSA